jgi:hypothetical protein
MLEYDLIDGIYGLPWLELMVQDPVPVVTGKPLVNGYNT